MKICIFCLFILSTVLTSGASAHSLDTLFDEPSIGAAMKIMREIDVTNDNVPELLKIETSQASKFSDIKIRLTITSKGKMLYKDEWSANDYFDTRDTISDTVKWWRLQKILSVYFANENFTSSNDPIVPAYQDLEKLFTDVQPADITPGSSEAKEFTSSPHRVFHIYAGRDNLYALTYLGSKKNFLKLWRN